VLSTLRNGDEVNSTFELGKPHTDDHRVLAQEVAGRSRAAPISRIWEASRLSASMSLIVI
jgi:hypothetical protein